MKWIRWDGNGSFDFQRDKPDEGSEDWDQCLSDEYVVCEKHDDWREIELGTLNLEDGKLHITLKPLPEPEKEPTLVEAAKNYLKNGWQTYRTHELGGLQSLGFGTSLYDCAIKLAAAIEREEKKTLNPYAKEAVDEFLMSCIEYPTWLTQNHRSRDWCDGAANMWEKFQVLLRQREAANVQ